MELDYRGNRLVVVGAVTSAAAAQTDGVRLVVLRLLLMVVVWMHNLVCNCATAAVVVVAEQDVFPCVATVVIFEARIIVVDRMVHAVLLLLLLLVQVQNLLMHDGLVQGDRGQHHAGAGGCLAGGGTLGHTSATERRAGGQCRFRAGAWHRRRRLDRHVISDDRFRRLEQRFLLQQLFLDRFFRN